MRTRMRAITSTEPSFAAPDCAVCADTAPPNALAQSALQITREALARWSGKPQPAVLLARDLPRVSPQARWLAQAQFGLADWIAQGGFAQDGASLSMGIDLHSDACID